MSQYNLFICNQQRRIKYPKSYHLTNVEAARRVALRVAKVFMEVVPYLVEIDDEGGQTVLVVLFNEVKEPN
jgi:hypothetical protein